MRRARSRFLDSFFLRAGRQAMRRYILHFEPLQYCFLFSPHVYLDFF